MSQKPKPRPINYIECTATATAADLLVDFDVLGIRECRPVGKPIWWYDDDDILCKQIGQISVNVDTGLVEIWPAGGNHMYPIDHANLRSQGIDAFRNPPADNEQWSLGRVDGRGEYWECAISVEVDLTTSNAARIIRSAHRRAMHQELAFEQRYVDTTGGQGSAA
ncbi:MULTISPECIES: hypothetical protein [Nocardia]|uniref:hypothetical protein n=1 Tax=Nocardia TaxID=1817 RepID=UPI000D69D30D|nr:MULTISPECIES: hypothetical protein [Nocardia]